MAPDATNSLTNEQAEQECGEPCPPDNTCDYCEGYWQRMEHEGYWRNGRWTNKGWREILSHL